MKYKTIDKQYKEVGRGIIIRCGQSLKCTLNHTCTYLLSGTGNRVPHHAPAGAWSLQPASVHY